MALAFCALTVQAQEKLPLKLIATTPMPGFTGDFDHLTLVALCVTLVVLSLSRRPSSTIVNDEDKIRSLA